MNKLKKTKEFNEIYKNSYKIYTKYTIIFIKEKNNNKNRFGFVASKKTGNAVKRNRIKRLIKEFVRLNEKNIKKGYDYIFVGKSMLKNNIDFLSYKDIEKDLKKILKQNITKRK